MRPAASTIDNKSKQNIIRLRCEGNREPINRHSRLQPPLSNSCELRRLQQLPRRPENTNSWWYASKHNPRMFDGPLKQFFFKIEVQMMCATLTDCDVDRNLCSSYLLHFRIIVESSLKRHSPRTSYLLLVCSHFTASCSVRRLVTVTHSDLWRHEIARRIVFARFQPDRPLCRVKKRPHLFRVKCAQCAYSGAAEIAPEKCPAVADSHGRKPLPQDGVYQPICRCQLPPKQWIPSRRMSANVSKSDSPLARIPSA